MFRDEIGGYSEPPRPQRKTPWLLIVCVLLVGLALAHVAGLTKPFATMAVQLCQGGSRNLRTPTGRLVGDWESDDDPMFRRVCHLKPEKDWHGTGLYMADAGSGMREVIYKVVSEDCSGTDLVLAECLVRTGANYQVRYSVARDGQSMTREYEGPNGHVSCQYRYLGPPTEELPQRCPFE